jgi:hypothetical protein
MPNFCAAQQLLCIAAEFDRALPELQAGEMQAAGHRRRQGCRRGDLVGDVM